MRPSTNPLLLEALALEIKRRRQELSITQEDLAGRCELDRPYVTMIEVAKKQPTVSVLYKLALGLELSLSEFASRIEARLDTLSKVRKNLRTEKISKSIAK